MAAATVKVVVLGLVNSAAVNAVLNYADRMTVIARDS